MGVVTRWAICWQISGLELPQDVFLLFVIHQVATFGRCNGFYIFQWVVLIRFYLEVLMEVLGT